jgi:hypothetical protein
MHSHFFIRLGVGVFFFFLFLSFTNMLYELLPNAELTSYQPYLLSFFPFFTFYASFFYAVNDTGNVKPVDLQVTCLSDTEGTKF